MPTATFFNLPEDKRERLLHAIRQEFSRTTFADVSINQIIRAAGISRGSFYQYFEDKRDALNYLLVDYRRMMLACVRESMEKSGGDIFTLFSDVLDFTIEFGFEQDTRSFIRNLFADMRVNSNLYADFVRKNGRREFPEAFIKQINVEILDVSGPEELKSMLEILSSVTREATVQFYTGRGEKDAVRRQHQQKMRLLKRGFLKEKENTECYK